MRGDSHIKRVKRNLYDNLFETDISYIKSFSDAETQDLMHNIIPSLAKQKLDIAVIYIGGNDMNLINAEHLKVDTLAEWKLILLCERQL